MSPAEVGEAWAFAVARHGRPGVEPALHALQDAHGQSVMLLLYAAWLAHTGRAAPLAEAAAAARAWTETAVAPLRAVRRALKTAELPGEPTARAALRGQVLGLELEAERLMLASLPAGPAGVTGGDVAAAVVAAAAAWDGRPPPPPLREALQRVAALLAT